MKSIINTTGGRCIKCGVESQQRVCGYCTLLGNIRKENLILAMGALIVVTLTLLCALVFLVV